MHGARSTAWHTCGVSERATLCFRQRAGKQAGRKEEEEGWRRGEEKERGGGEGGGGRKKAEQGRRQSSQAMAKGKAAPGTGTRAYVGGPKGRAA